MDNLFFSTTVHLSAWPPKRVLGDPIELHTQDEAIQKMHRFCHEIYHIPITWITSWGALMRYGDILRKYCEEYGDEVGIMEYGIYSSDVLEGKAHIYQGWVEELGMKRPGGLDHTEKDVPDILTWYAMNYEDQKKAITYLQKVFEDKLGRKVTTFATPFHNQDTIKIISDLGFTCLWGNNWNYFCEGMDHKGTMPHAFYYSKDRYFPENNSKDRGPLAIQWGTGGRTVDVNVDLATRRAPSWCTNPTEYANRGVGLDQYNYFEKCFDEHVSNRAYNPFVYIPIQLEAVWMDEGEMVEGFLDQYPDYNLRCTEVFYAQIEKCLELDAKCVTQSEFAKWHDENMKETTECIFYSRDLTPPGLRLNGKDREYDPIIIFANKKVQYVFSKENGINYKFRWIYGQNVDVKEKIYKQSTPRVQLQNFYSVKIHAGIHLNDKEAVYKIDGLDFSSYEDHPDYGGVIWTANIPEYVNEENIEVKGLKDYRLLKKHNALLFFADMKEGDNHFNFESREADKYIKIERQEVVGRRYEIWIKNEGCDVALCKLNVNIGPGRKLGCCWWNGKMYRDLEVYDACVYNQFTGELSIAACYPASYKLRQGYNRLSIELF